MTEELRMSKRSEMTSYKGTQHGNLTAVIRSQGGHRLCKNSKLFILYQTEGHIFYNFHSITTLPIFN